MNSGDTILIASTSEPIIDYVTKRLKENGVNCKIHRTLKQADLYNCLALHSPQTLLIEGSFWFGATPEEMLDLVNRYNNLRIYAFGLADYTLHYIKRLIHAGTDGYLNARQGRPIFREELRQAISGKLVIPPEIESDGLDYLPESKIRLTPGDMKLVDLICEEMDNKGIARALNLADQTVRNRRADLYAKLNVNNTIGLLKCLFRKGILNLNDFLAS